MKLPWIIISRKEAEWITRRIDESKLCIQKCRGSKFDGYVDVHMNVICRLQELLWEKRGAK